ncbi:MAG: hypothetical protein AAF738_09450 [Bacteroidota bacterium]
MQLPTRNYPSKVILFGEYTVLHSGTALAIPLPNFASSWAKGKHDTSAHLSAFASYLQDLHKQEALKFSLNIPAFQATLKEQYFLASNIPIGYGLGSSGTVCAAIYNSFAETPTPNLEALKIIFAQMESYFHGASSGTDPLISYLNVPIHLTNTGIMTCTVPPLAENTAFFLLNTQKARKSDRFISWFMEQSQQSNYRKALNMDLIPAIEEVIAMLFEQSSRKDMLTLMHQISLLQQQYFRPMLLPELESLWQEGLESTYFKLKICGAGGGGFFLGYTDDWKRLQQHVVNFPLTKITFQQGVSK